MYGNVQGLHSHATGWEATVAGDTATVRQFKLMNPHVTIQVFESNWVNGAQREISKYVVGADQSVAYFREDIVHQCGTEATEENVHKWITEIKTFTAMPSILQHLKSFSARLGYQDFSCLWEVTPK